MTAQQDLIADDHRVWARRRRVAKEVFLPWLESVRPLEGATVLEFGCGKGAISSVFAEVADRHIGYDIDEEAVHYARKKLARRGLRAEFHAERPDRILDALSVHRGEVDVLLLYAVIEHLNIQERLALLDRAPALLRPGGVVAVVELPNRLVIPDHHTSQLPFFSQLPDELALRYWPRSKREDFTDAMRAATEKGDAAAAETLTRWGRGASFHEFEVVYGDLRRHVIASSFDPRLLHERHVHSDELALARVLERARPDLAPCFGRYWIDFVFSPEPIEPATVGFIWPWTMETQALARARWTQLDAIELSADNPLTVRLPCPSRRIVVGAYLPGEDDPVVAVAKSGTDARAALRGPANEVRYADISLGHPVAEVDITIDRSGYVTFVGYEAPADRGLAPTAWQPP